MRESFDTPGVPALLPPPPGAGQGSPAAKPEPVPLPEELEVPGCAGSGWPVVPKVEVNAEGDGEEPGGPEQSGTEDWLVRKVKVEEEYEEWPASLGTVPHAGGMPGCAGACKAERPCLEDLGYGEPPAFAVPPWLLLGQGLDGAGDCERCFQARLSGEGEPRERGAPAPPRPFACAQCGKGFGKKAHLTRHLRVHTGERPFPCGQCGRRFRQKIHLRSHQKTHTGERPFPCAECGRRFRKKTHLVRHQRTHTGERPFACARCARRFAHKQHLLRHQQLHAEPEPEPGSEPAPGHCDAALAGEQKLLPCPEDEEKSAAAPGRPRHEDPPFTCAECGCGFGDEQRPMVPPQGHAGPEPFARAPAPTDPWHGNAAERPFCPRCALAFARHRQLPRHARVHGGERPFACPQRGCAFAARPDARPGARPFACELCGRGFGRKSHLARHQAVHTGTRPHACAQCAKRFSSKTNLVRHQAVHTGHRPYSCARCGKSFSRKTHLLRHERTHAGGAGTVPQQSWPAPATLCP